MLLAIALLVTAGLVQGEPPIETCRVVAITEDSTAVVCKEDRATGFFSGYLLSRAWPVEWEDSTKVGDVVKLQVTKNGGFIPIASCKARIAKVVKEATRSRVGERRMPTNWYVPKDCMGEKEN